MLPGLPTVGFFKKFFYWTYRCTENAIKRNRLDGAHVGVDNSFAISMKRAVAYATKCPVSDDDSWSEETLPEIIRGVFFIDWDQDGDADLAVLLKSGRYVFFRREDCCPECIS